MQDNTNATRISEELNAAVRRLNTAQELVRQELKEVTRLSDLLEELRIEAVQDDNRNQPTEQLPVAQVVRVPHQQQIAETHRVIQDIRPNLLGSTFAIGDTVRILNPRPGQPRQGVISALEEDSLTLDHLIIKISREPKNLRPIAQPPLR